MATTRKYPAAALMYSSKLFASKKSRVKKAATPAISTPVKKDFFHCTPEPVARAGKKLSPEARSLYIMLASYIPRRTNRWQATLDDIVEKVGFPRKRVLSATQELEMHNFIKVDRAPRGSHVSNVYHLWGETARTVLGWCPMERAGVAPKDESPPAKPKRPKTEHDASSAVTPLDASSSVSGSVQVSPAHASADLSVSNRHSNQHEVLKPTLKNQDQLTTTTSLLSSLPSTEPKNKIIPLFGTPAEQSASHDDQHNIPRIAGLKDETISGLIRQYGSARVQEVFTQCQQQSATIRNPRGWIYKALAQGWSFDAPAPKVSDEDDGMRYIRGKYAEFIQH